MATDDVTIEPNEDELEPKDQLKKLRERLKTCVDEKQEYLDGWQRERAQFANLRKQDEKDKKEFIKFANENLISELLPVLDSFNSAFANKESWEKVDKNWRVGVEYIANQLKKVLEDSGVKEIDPIGQKFDPLRDEAIEFEPVTDEKQDNVVVAVLHKGYTYNNKVMKAPKVKVGEFKKQ